MNLKEFYFLYKEGLKSWVEDDVFLLAGAMSFFTVLSFIPLVVILIALSGLLIGPEQARHEIFHQVAYFSSEQTVAMLEKFFAGAQKASAKAASIYSGILIFVLSLGVYTELQNALRIIWNEKRKRRHFLLDIVRTRLFSFFMFLGTGLFLFSAFFIDIGLEMVSPTLHTWFPAFDALYVWKNVSPFVFGCLFTIFCATIYRFGPGTKVAWGDVWVGAITTSILFCLGRYLLSIYFQYSIISSLYGAAGSIIVILLWIFYSFQIFFYGAEVSWVYAQVYGSRSRSS